MTNSKYPRDMGALKEKYPNITFLDDEHTQGVLDGFAAGEVSGEGEFHERLSYLNTYGGVVNDGVQQELPTFRKDEDPEYVKWITEGIEKHNAGPTDLRPNYQVRLSADWAPHSFGIDWYKINLESGDYRYTFSGGLVYHGGGNETLTVSLVSQTWGIHT